MNPSPRKFSRDSTRSANFLTQMSKHHYTSHQKVLVEVTRRDSPKSSSYVERFAVDFEAGLNITSVLQRIAAQPVTVEGKATTPVAYETACLEEVCGSCTMLINGRVRQACSALVENLRKEGPGLIRLAPMAKFPTIRDLIVDRSRLFEDLKRAHAWIDVDDYSDRGPGPRMPPATQEEAYPLSKCMSCGCCLEACPQYNDKSRFIGAAVVSQIIYFNEHPVGRFAAGERLDVLNGPDGIANCGNAQLCVQVCPKDIPLTDSIAKAGRQATVHALKRLLGR